MKAALLVIALLLAAGVSVWYGRSGTQPAPLAPAPAAQPAGPAGQSAALEAESARREAVPAPQPALAAADAAPQAPPRMIELGAGGAGPDGGITSDISATTDTSPYAAKYAAASPDEIKANYEALRLLYDENKEGRVEDKSRQLSSEVLAELENELAWLKEKAFGGG